MIITKMALPRRTFLRGVGVSLALPLLDAMVPALTAFTKTAAKPFPRLNIVYTPNGMAMPFWVPKTDGETLEITPILEPLAPYASKILKLGGLTSKPAGSTGGGNHANAAAKFLTGIAPRQAVVGVELSVSMDQLAANVLGRETQLASLELGLDSRDFTGTCDAGYSCTYTTTISWRGATTPLPTENDPRVVFERMFGDSGSTDPAARLEQIKTTRSILDSLTEKVSDIERRIAPSDRLKLAEYLEGVRDVERRIQKAEEQLALDVPLVEQPSGFPGSYKEHAELMFDLQMLAFQTDLTRVITFMLGREVSGRSYPEIGVPEAHHPLSHHEDNPLKIETLSKINIFHTSLFAGYLEKLQKTEDGAGSLLDQTLILYGSGMSNSNLHAPENLPLLLVGGGIKGGRQITYRAGTPTPNLHLAILDRLGVPVHRLGDSTGKVELEPLSGV